MTFETLTETLSAPLDMAVLDFESICSVKRDASTAAYGAFFSQMKEDGNIHLL